MVGTCLKKESGKMVKIKPLNFKNKISAKKFCKKTYVENFELQILSGKSHEKMWRVGWGIS